MESVGKSLQNAQRVFYFLPVTGLFLAELLRIVYQRCQLVGLDAFFMWLQPLVVLTNDPGYEGLIRFDVDLVFQAFWSLLAGPEPKLDGGIVGGCDFLRYGSAHEFDRIRMRRARGLR